MVVTTSEEGWLVSITDPNRYIRVALKSATSQDELLLHITVVENGKAYSHDELIPLDNLDYFMVIHVSGWLARHFRIEIDRILYERLENTKKLFTKRMLREGDIIEKVKIY
jgi:hypothetical protein